MPTRPWGNPAYVTSQYMLADDRFRQGFAVLGRLGLSFDAWLFHPQIDELADLARAFPNTRIVLNHVGGPIGIGAYAVSEKTCLLAGRLRSRNWRPSGTCMSGSGALACASAGLASTSSRNRLRLRCWQMHGAHILKLASRPLDRPAQCSRAISRSTRAPTAMRCSGMHASCWRKARPTQKGRISFRDGGSVPSPLII